MSKGCTSSRLECMRALQVIDTGALSPRGRKPDSISVGKAVDNAASIELKIKLSW